jgi:hypothetical protein
LVVDLQVSDQNIGFFPMPFTPYWKSLMSGALSQRRENHPERTLWKAIYAGEKYYFSKRLPFTLQE